MDGKVTIEVPKNYPIKYKTQNAGNVNIDEFEKNDIYTWSFTHQPLDTRYETDEPYENTNNLQIKVVPIEINYGKTGTQDSWVNLGNWIADLNAGKQDIPISE